MKVSTFADLLDVQAISRSALDDALVRDAPKAVAWCDRPDSLISRHALGAQLMQAMPEAFNVGLKECIAHRWLPTTCVPQNVRGDLCLDLHIEPAIDLMRQGWPERTLQLSHEVSLQQTQTTYAISFDGAGWLLQLGEPRAWRANLRLWVSDAGTTVRGEPFHERTLEVFLPKGPWKF
jgi:hypothetical protein